MRGVNKVILVGTLGRDPETKSFPNGGSLTQFSIATSESWNDKNSGERQEITEWHRIVLNNRLGEVAQQYLKKGSKVYIEGSLRTRKWTDKEGQERYTTEIRGDSMQMLDGRANSGDGQNSDNGSYNSAKSSGGGYGSGQSSNQNSNQQGEGYSSANYQQASGAAKSTPAAAPSYNHDLDDDLPF